MPFDQLTWSLRYTAINITHDNNNRTFDHELQSTYYTVGKGIHFFSFPITTVAAYE
jgi:hypothetical protein